MTDMMVILDQVELPETGVVRIQVDQTADIRISAEAARKRVRRWLREDVSLMMSANTPTLTLTERIVWRVSVTLSKTHLGTVGQIGTVDVDVLSGEIVDISESKKSALTTAAQAVSSTLPIYQPRQSVPQQFIPHNLPSSPILQLPEA